MKEVRIAKDALKARVQQNRRGHRVEYEAAIEGYRTTVLEWLSTQIDKAKAGHRDIEVYFSMPKPEDHTADYDNVLDMLAMSEDTTIVLSNQEFRCYVRDEWGWQPETKAIFSNYTR